MPRPITRSLTSLLPGNSGVRQPLIALPFYAMRCRVGPRRCLETLRTLLCKRIIKRFTEAQPAIKTTLTAMLTRGLRQAAYTALPGEPKELPCLGVVVGGEP